MDVGVPDASSRYSGTYPAGNLVDGDPNTAWIEGASGYGLGEVIEFQLGRLSPVPRIIEIRPGYQKSESLHERNGRPSRIELSYLADDPDAEQGLFELASYEVDLIRDYSGDIPMQAQYVHIGNADMLHNMAFGELSVLRIEILAVDHDDMDPDTAMSEIRLFREGEVVGVRRLGPAD
jgi:hypothetical protein